MKTETKVKDLPLDQIEAIKAHNIAQRIAIRQRAMNQTFIEQGEDLILMCEFVEISETEQVQRFKLLGYDTFESFVASPETNIEIRTAHLYKSVVQKFIHELQIDDIDLLVHVGVSKLGLLWYHVTEENVQWWLETAVSVSRADLLKTIDEKALGFQTGFDAEKERPFLQRLQVNFDDPPVVLQHTVITYLVNEFLRLHPDAATNRDFKTAVEVMKKFAH